MKLLFIHAGVDLYGASRSLYRLAKGLVADGHELLVLLPGGGPLHDALAGEGIDVRVHPRMPILSRHRLKRPLDPFRLAADLFVSEYQIRSIIREFRPDVLHANSAVVLSGGIAAFLSGVPHIRHFRESFAMFPQWLWRLYRAYVQVLSTRVVCVSQAVADQFGPAGSNPHVLVLHNGIPLQEVAEVERDETIRVRQRWKPDGHLLVAVIGRIKCPDKGQDVFVKAAALLKKDFPKTRFLIIGTPFPGNEHHRTLLEQLIDQEGLQEHVLFAGELANLYPAYACTDIVVMPSGLPEGFPGVVVEAMASGVPVVGTTAGGTREQIEDGITGYLVPPGSPVQMADALRRLLESDSRRAAMGEAARRRYLERFEFDRFYRAMLDVYRGVASSPASAHEQPSRGEQVAS